MCAAIFLFNDLLNNQHCTCQTIGDHNKKMFLSCYQVDYLWQSTSCLANIWVHFSISDSHRIFEETFGILLKCLELSGRSSATFQLLCLKPSWLSSFSKIQDSFKAHAVLGLIPSLQSKLHPFSASKTEWYTSYLIGANLQELVSIAKR